MTVYKQVYSSPLGNISVIVSDKEVLGIWFEEQAYFEAGMSKYEVETTPLHQEVFSWLDQYFSGQQPDGSLPLAFRGTSFQVSVWKYLLTIPYGETRAYGQIVQALQLGSPRSVGGAVGRNPVSIVIPCHRVLGAKGALTGYAGGMDKKRWLLDHEGRNR